MESEGLGKLMVLVGEVMMLVDYCFADKMLWYSGRCTALILDPDLRFRSSTKSV